MGFLSKLFGGKKQLTAAEAAAEIVGHHLREHGTPTRVQANAFIPESLGYPCECRVYPTGGPTRFQLDVVTWLDPESDFAVIESVACMGNTDQEALAAGVHKWLHNVYPVLESGLTDREQVEGVARQPLLLREGPDAEPVAWTAHVGGVLYMSAGAELAADLPMFATVAPALRSLEAGGEVAWLRMFAGGATRDELIHECLLMNDPWDDGRAALATMPWPGTDGFLSARQFVILRRDQPSPGG